MQRILSPAAVLAIAVMTSAAMPVSSACQTIESVPILATGRGSDANAVSAPMTDTTRQNRMVWPIAPDDASYGLTRWYLDRRLLPAPEAIRITDLANAFDAAPRSVPANGAFAPLRGDVLGIIADVFPSPTRRGHHILHLSLRGRSAGRRSTVFVVVVESSAPAIPRIRDAIRALADALADRDLLGLVGRGPRGRTILEPTRLGSRQIAARAIDALTGGGEPDLITGLLAGYDLATRQSGGRPARILLFSDGAGLRFPGDQLFNDLGRQARAGLTLSVVGFPGAGYDHRLMARLARGGDGRYAVVDNSTAARGLFPRLPDSLNVVAREVTGRIELSPETVSRFRFLGDQPRYPTAEGTGRSLGAGSRATALIELQLTGRPGPLGAVRVRYRPAEGDVVKRVEMTLPRQSTTRDDSTGLLPWIAATFGEKLAGSYWARDVSYSRLLDSFRSLDAGRRSDPRTAELRYLMQQAQRLEAHRDRSRHTGRESDPRRPVDDTFDQLRVIE